MCWKRLYDSTFSDIRGRGMFLILQKAEFGIKTSEFSLPVVCRVQYIVSECIFVFSRILRHDITNNFFLSTIFSRVGEIIRLKGI